jgi:hypothetical protein
VYYVYGQALADILGKELGIEVTAQATQGPTRNIILIETGHAGLGLITMGVGWEAWNGTGEWTKGKNFGPCRRSCRCTIRPSRLPSPRAQT